MGLTNSQYDEIMRNYDSRQIANRHKTEEHIAEAYEKDPRLKEIDDSIARYSVAAARRLLNGDQNAVSDLKNIIAEIHQQREDILSTLGYSKDFFEPVYSCPDCKDTGYINGKKCHCLQQAILNKVYAQSNLSHILSRENFSTLRYDFYSDAPNSFENGISELDNMRSAVAECHRFVDTFRNQPNNLLLMGNTGTGKTFLSNCIAKELLDRGHSVIYFSAAMLFENLSRSRFDRDSDAIEANKNIFDCDLLIIDDLGTETTNSFTVSQLFLCINERILRQKSTIISTNLNLGNLANVYSERIASRLSSAYNIIKLSANDIRIQCKLQKV